MPGLLLYPQVAMRFIMAAAAAFGTQTELEGSSRSSDAWLLD